MTDWMLLRLKRRWVPEWLWRMMGQLPVRQPWRWLFTRKPSLAEEAREL